MPGGPMWPQQPGAMGNNIPTPMQQHTTGPMAPMTGGPAPFQMMQGIPNPMGNQMAQMQPQMQPQMQSYQMMSMQGAGAQQMPYPAPTHQMPGGGIPNNGLGNNSGPSGSAFGFVSSSGQMGQPMISPQPFAAGYAPPQGMVSGRLDEPSAKDSQFGFVADEMKGA